MSVLKSIFHRYNKTTSSYDTLHPETEHSQVTDFGQGVLTHLAASTLASAISTLSSESLFSKLLALALSAAGVQYNMAQNGYIKFGSLFGGLIIQWGLATVSNANGIVALPLTVTAILTAIVSYYNGQGNGSYYNSTELDNFTTTSFNIHIPITGNTQYCWITISK